MQVTSATFTTSAVRPSGYPPEDLPEVAFAGRSNVGKSSLINTLVNRKRLVKTSNTPGRTQLINFFDINNTFRFVDLPGYGYAKVPLAVKKKWGPMVETYLRERRTLCAVALLLDIRRLPDDKDLGLLGWLERYQRPAIIFLTKADKLSRSRQQRETARIADRLRLPPAGLIPFSVKSRLGLETAWNTIARHLPAPGDGPRSETP